MKKFVYNFVLALLALSGLASASPVTVASITQSEFNNLFNSSQNLFYAEYRAGGISGLNSDEIEIGNFEKFADETGQTTWLNNQNNHFIISMSGGNTLTAAVNGNYAGAGFGVSNPFNEIWFGLKLDTGVSSDNILVTHSFDGIDLPSINITTNPGFYGFKIHDTRRLSNIGQFELVGNLNMNIFTHSSDNWNYVIVGTLNPAIIPEPSTLILLLVSLVSLLFCKQAKLLLR
jgi:hypothetical protein